MDLEKNIRLKQKSLKNVHNQMQIYNKDFKMQTNLDG
jgi:hypothetical protein